MFRHAMLRVICCNPRCKTILLGELTFGTAPKRKNTNLNQSNKVPLHINTEKKVYESNKTELKKGRALSKEEINLCKGERVYQQ
jgi:hypothetical protein